MKKTGRRTEKDEVADRPRCRDGGGTPWSRENGRIAKGKRTTTGEAPATPGATGKEPTAVQRKDYQPTSDQQGMLPM